MLLALVVTAAMEPLMPALLKPLIDESMIAKNMDYIILVPVLLMIVFIIKGIAEYFAKVFSEWIAQKAILNIRAEMFAKLNYLPLETYQQYTTGKLMSKLTYDVAQIGSTLSEAWVIVIRDILIIIGLLAFLFFTSWQLTLLIILVGPILGFIIDRAGKMMRGSSTQMQNKMGEMTQSLEEALNSHKDIKIYGADKYEQKKFFNISESFRQHTMSVVKVSAANVPLVQVIAAMALSAVLLVVSLMSAEDMFTPGELIAFIVASAMIFEPIRRLTNVNEIIQRGMAAAKSVFELLDQENEQNNGTKILNNINGSIEFKNVQFCYKTANKNTITNLSFNIKPKTTTALVGESGSGKTTIANLIPRLIEATSGQILIDDIDTKQIELFNLRTNISYVNQDIMLFNDSIKANIAYGDDTITEEEIVTAAKAAYAWGFIQNLPEGLDTIIGDNGALLSGGQRQRIAIARAFLKNAPILILDEATSALDNESEIKIQNALHNLKKDKTVIIIAHRLSTIEAADNIIVLQQGKLIEQGTHSQLLKTQGYYQRLYATGFANT